MKLIQLHGKWGEGKFTMVDDERFNELNQYQWHATKDGYVERKSRLMANLIIFRCTGL